MTHIRILEFLEQMVDGQCVSSVDCMMQHSESVLVLVVNELLILGQHPTSPRFGYIIPDPLILLMFVKNCHISLLKCSCNATKKRGEVRLLPNNLTVLLICNPRISMS